MRLANSFRTEPLSTPASFLMCLARARHDTYVISTRSVDILFQAITSSSTFSTAFDAYRQPAHPGEIRPDSQRAGDLYRHVRHLLWSAWLCVAGSFSNLAVEKTSGQQIDSQQYTNDRKRGSRALHHTSLHCMGSYGLWREQRQRVTKASVASFRNFTNDEIRTNTQVSHPLFKCEAQRHMRCCRMLSPPNAASRQLARCRYVPTARMDGDA